MEVCSHVLCVLVTFVYQNTCENNLKDVGKPCTSQWLLGAVCLDGTWWLEHLVEELLRLMVDREAGRIIQKDWAGCSSKGTAPGTNFIELDPHLFIFYHLPVMPSTLNLSRI